MPLLVCLLVVGCGEEVTQEAVVATTEEPARPTEAEAERLLETAIDWNSLVLAAQGNNQQAASRASDYTGWVKKTFTNGQKKSLGFLGMAFRMARSLNGTRMASDPKRAF